MCVWTDVAARCAPLWTITATLSGMAFDHRRVVLGLARRLDADAGVLDVVEQVHPLTGTARVPKGCPVGNDKPGRGTQLGRIMVLAVHARCPGESVVPRLQPCCGMRAISPRVFVGLGTAWWQRGPVGYLVPRGREPSAEEWGGPSSMATAAWRAPISSRSSRRPMRHWRV